jgi:hypothetical protein
MATVKTMREEGGKRVKREIKGKSDTKKERTIRRGEENRIECVLIIEKMHIYKEGKYVWRRTCKKYIKQERQEKETRHVHGQAKQ